ncbi:hypothetical protein [Marinospirillum minutulum]|uniref:hypothetical protein n=1 Tax=Marinospirillum minutulum TaxID=64974 RepID=UPI000400728D|nr:hypothetical protein [Marinospirillum minutulum]
MKQVAKDNQGFVLVPVIVLMLISLLMILIGGRELQQAVLIHHLKLYQDCTRLEIQLDLKASQTNKSFCQVCSKAVGCYED